MNLEDLIRLVELGQVGLRKARMEQITTCQFKMEQTIRKLEIMEQKMFQQFNIALEQFQKLQEVKLQLVMQPLVMCIQVIKQLKLVKLQLVMQRLIES